MQRVLFSEVDEAVQLRAAFVAADVARDAVSPPPQRAEYFVLSLEESRLDVLVPQKDVCKQGVAHALLDI